MQMLQAALDKNADIGQLQALMELQERWEKNEARKAYHRAFSGFKSEAIQVIKQTNINDGPLKGKKYADLAAAVDAATPMLAKWNLSAAWKITKDEKDWIEATCTLTHVDGHSESTSFGGPPDAGGAKNAVQARASTLNYLQRYTFLAVTGLAAKNVDNDGAGATVGMPDGQLADFHAAIEALTDDVAAGKLWETITQACIHAHDVEANNDLRSAMLAKRKALKK
jgi:hypothetical protein